MFCSLCGTRLSATARYCEECGTPVARNAPAAPSCSLRAPAGSLHVSPLINVTVTGAAPAQPMPARAVLVLPSPRQVGWWGIVGLWSVASLAFTGNIRLSVLLLGTLLVVGLVNRLLWSLRPRLGPAGQQGGLWFLVGSSGLLLGGAGFALMAWARFVAPYILWYQYYGVLGRHGIVLGFFLVATFWLLDMLWLYSARHRS